MASPSDPARVLARLRKVAFEEADAEVRAIRASLHRLDGMLAAHEAAHGALPEAARASVRTWLATARRHLRAVSLDALELFDRPPPPIELRGEMAAAEAEVEAMTQRWLGGARARAASVPPRPAARAQRPERPSLSMVDVAALERRYAAALARRQRLVSASDAKPSAPASAGSAPASATARSADSGAAPDDFLRDRQASRIKEDGAAARELGQRMHAAIARHGGTMYGIISRGAQAVRDRIARR